MPEFFNVLALDQARQVLLERPDVIGVVAELGQYSPQRHRERGTPRESLLNLQIGKLTGAKPERISAKSDTGRQEWYYT
jgi:hypothetical protein